MQDIRDVSKAPTEQAAFDTLNKLEETWVRNILWLLNLGETNGAIFQLTLSIPMKSEP